MVRNLLSQSRDYLNHAHQTSLKNNRQLSPRASPTEATQMAQSRVKTTMAVSRSHSQLSKHLETSNIILGVRTWPTAFLLIRAMEVSFQEFPWLKDISNHSTICQHLPDQALEHSWVDLVQSVVKLNIDRVITKSIWPTKPISSQITCHQTSWAHWRKATVLQAPLEISRPPSNSLDHTVPKSEMIYTRECSQVWHQEAEAHHTITSSKTSSVATTRIKLIHGEDENTLETGKPDKWLISFNSYFFVVFKNILI